VGALPDLPMNLSEAARCADHSRRCETDQDVNLNGIATGPRSSAYCFRKCHTAVTFGH